MKRRLAAAVIAVSALGVIATAAPASAAPQLCINADLNVNGTAQTISQCLPQ